jgi:kynurenine formamidase
VGRGVLLDYVAYAARHNIEYSPMSKHGISLAALKDMAKEGNITFRAGDILLVRTGWTKWYDEHTQEERVKYVTNGSAWVGVQGSEETLEWLWDNHFAAVAGDAIGFEVWPPQEPWKMHDFLLAGWGCPIGEMWDLEALAAECEKEQRWTFFLTSAPLNTKGGVASPPNAVGIF